MKVSKWVDMGQEVEIEVGVDDIRGALAEAFARVTNDRLGEDGPTAQEVMFAFNSIAQFLRAITNEQISHMNVHQLATIAGFLDTQAKRYAQAEPASEGKKRL